MPVTFNTNNNYDVEIVTESDLNSPTTLQYSSNTNTAFVEMKITAVDPQANPVLVSNLKFDGKVPDFAWNGSTQMPQACVPPPPPHDAISSLQHVTGISIPSTCITGPLGFGHSSFFGNSNIAQQGPYEVQYDFTEMNDQIMQYGVGIQNIVLIEVYEDDNGVLVNDQHSPASDENYNHWQMWVDDSYYGSPATHPITTNTYPVFVKAFVFLQFDPGGVYNNTTLEIDVDEVEPVYGCIDPNADNYNPIATVNDGSCTYPPVLHTITFSPVLNNATGQYTNTFLNSDFALANPSNLKNMIFNPQPGSSGGTNLVLANTYAAGDFVNELVQIDLFPVNPSIGLSNFEAVYDFPVASNPPATNGGPPANIPLTPGYFQRPSNWGDAKNNLTGASVRMLSVDPPATPTYEIPTFDENGNPVFVYGGYSPWCNQADPTGVRPTTHVFFEDDIHALDPSGNTFTIETDGIHIEEFYHPIGNSELILNPGYEWFPYKLQLNIQLSFQMPDFPLSIVLDIDHNTENQGDLNWVPPGGN